MKKITLKDIREFQKKRKSIVTIGEFKQLGIEVRDKFLLKDIDAISVINGNSDDILKILDKYGINEADLQEENRLLKEKLAIMSRLLPSGVDNYSLTQYRVGEEIVRHAGCNCGTVLLGYRIGKGPRCRLCNVESQIVYEE